MGLLVMGWAWVGVSAVLAQEEIALWAPRSYEALQGKVVIQGRIPPLEGFAWAEIAFAAADSPQTWFLIQRLEQPTEGPLTVWDTRQVRDGVYHLRLLVVFQDGRQEEVRVEGLRLQNYLPTATPTPFPTPVPLQPLAPPGILSPTPTATFWPTPTPLPANPLSLSEKVLQQAWGWGLAAGVLLSTILIVGIRRRTL